jgi:predicted PurR-regulated permease PerM
MDGPPPPPTQRVEITISWKTLAVIGLAAALAWAMIAARDAFLLLFIALFLALVLETPATWQQQRWGMRRGTAAMLLVFGTLGVLALLGYLLVAPFVGAVQDLARDLPNIVQRIRDSDLFQQLDRRTDIGAELQQRAEELAAELPGKLDDVVAIGGKAFGAGLASFAVVFMTLFLVIDLPNLSASLRSVLFPGTADRVHGLEDRITRTIGRYAIGAVVIATIAGVVQGLGAWALGAPFALALGIIAGLLGLIPQVGATIAAVLLSLVTLTVGWPQALAMLAICIGYQQVENYVLQPTIQGRAADISGFFVIASVVVGASLLGVIGALIAVPLTASVQIVVRELTAERRAAVERARASAERARGAPPPGGGGGPLEQSAPG